MCVYTDLIPAPALAQRLEVEGGDGGRVAMTYVLYTDLVPAPALAQRLEVERGDGRRVAEHADDDLAADVVAQAVVVLHLHLQRRLVRHREVLVAGAQRHQ